ncbi:hypothetical protein LCGC14_2755810 [marine sediment metagenome]|uniref:Uncharacterized protein n=1 Tax=marine sediment metagenome TaxID=412755 RepID=A0A0F8Z0K5_9ZZZZ
MKRKIYLFFKTYSYGMFMGFALGCFCDIHWHQWQFYATLVPLVILVAWRGPPASVKERYQ